MQLFEQMSFVLVARIEEQDSGFQMTPPTSSEELGERL
jgi:hypothetical protein